MTENDHTDCGCSEYNELSRRGFVQRSAGAAIAAVMMPEWLPRVVLAESAVSSRDVIVNIFLRGGADGLSLVAPFADVNYYSSRATLAIPRPDSGSADAGTALDNTFMFGKGMAALVPAFLSKQLLVVHGAGLSYVSRSHFDAQRFIEVGKANDKNIATGWIGRHLATSLAVKSTASLRGVAVSNGLPQSFVGAPLSLPIPDPTNFAISGSGATAQARQDWLSADYYQDQDPVRSSALDVTATLNLLKSINLGGYIPSNSAVYPNSGFGRSMKSTAALIKANIGVEAIEIDIGGWDTHTVENPINGQMYNTMRDLSTSIAAFWADVLQGNGTYNVTLVAMSEFGRNVRENGNQGTDHGRGGAMFVMGQSIDGGRVLTKNWVPLARANLADGQDVPVNIDHRDILAEIVQNRLGNTNVGAIFPGYTPVFQGITK